VYASCDFWQGITSVVLLFNDDVAEATVSIATSKLQQNQQLSVNKIDGRTFTFTAPGNHSCLGCASVFMFVANILEMLHKQGMTELPQRPLNTHYTACIQK